MLHETLPARPETLESRKFKLHKVSVDVFPRATPEGNKPYAELSHTFKGRDGLTHSQEIRVDCERVVEAAERVRTLLDQWRSESVLDRVASWFGGLLDGKKDVHEIGSFSLRNVARDLTVQVRAVRTEEGLKPYVKLRETVTRRDGRKELNAFVIDGKQLENLADRLRPILIEEAKQLEARQKTEQNKPRWWTVVRFEQSLETAAIVRIHECSLDRDSTFRRHHGGPLLVLSSPQALRRLPGERMMIAGGEDPRADEWIRNAKIMEEYHRRHPRIDLSRSPLTPEERADVKPIATVTVGNLKGDLVAARGEDGKWRRTLHVTRPVTGPDGITRPVTSEYSEAQCRAILRKADERGQSGTQEEPRERQSRPVRPVRPPFTVGDLHVHLIERTNKKGQPERGVVLTRTRFRPDGTIGTETAEYTVAQFRALYSRTMDPKVEHQPTQADGHAKAAVVGPTQPASQEQATGTNGNQPSPMPDYATRYAGYLNRLGEELRTQHVIGIWYGVRTPDKGDKIAIWDSGLSWDMETGTMKEGSARITPLTGQVHEVAPENPVYVVAKRTVDDTRVEILGTTRRLGYAQVKCQELEAEKLARDQRVEQAAAQSLERARLKQLEQQLRQDILGQQKPQKPEHGQPRQLPGPEREQHRPISLSR
jgi:hypothetical protein